MGWEAVELAMVTALGLSASALGAPEVVRRVDQMIEQQRGRTTPGQAPPPLPTRAPVPGRAP